MISYYNDIGLTKGDHFLADGQQNGEAKETVFVNSGPSNGACEVAPFSGEEFKTEFKVFCREWQDEVR